LCLPFFIVSVSKTLSESPEKDKYYLAYVVCLKCHGTHYLLPQRLREQGALVRIQCSSLLFILLDCFDILIFTKTQNSYLPCITKKTPDPGIEGFRVL